MAQRTPGEAFTEAMGAGLDKFVQTLLQAAQTQFQMDQAEKAQQLEQARYEQERRDRLEFEQRQAAREDANYVRDLIVSQQEMLTKQLAQVENPAMQSRLSGEINRLQQVLMEGGTDPAGVLQAYQQYREAPQREGASYTAPPSSVSQGMPANSVPQAPVPAPEVGVNIKGSAPPMQLAGEAAGQAGREDRRRQDLEAMRQKQRAELESNRQFYRNLYTQVAPAALDPNSSPEYRASVAKSFEGVPSEYLPPGAAAQLQEWAGATDPHAEELRDLKMRVARADATSAEQRVADFEWRNPAEQTQFFLDTGLGLGKLSDEQRAEVAQRLIATGELEVGGSLSDWAGTRFGELRTIQQAESQRAELQNEGLRVQIKRGNQEHERTAKLMEREEWAHQRNQIIAGRDDQRWAWEQENHGWQVTDRQQQNETLYTQNIGNAVANGAPEIIEMYLRMHDDPGSATGRVLRNLVPREVLEDKLAQAQEVRELEMRSLQASTEQQETAAQQAKLQLEQGQYLDPYYREALRLTYERDAGQARIDIQNLTFNDQANRLVALSELAQAVPPEVWENLPKGIKTQLTDLGLSSEVFAGMSAAAQFARTSPMRQEAWQQFEVLMQSFPRTATEAENALAAASETLSNAGVEGQAQAGVLTILQNVWATDRATEDRAISADQRAAAYLALQAASIGANIDENGNVIMPEGGGTAMEPTDVKRVVDGTSTLIDDQRQSLDSYADLMQAEGCALVVREGSSLFVMPRTEDSDGNPTVGSSNGQACSEMVSGYSARHSAIEQNINVLSGLVGQLGSVTGLDVDLSTETVPSATMIPEASPAAQDAVTSARNVIGQVNAGEMGEEEAQAEILRLARIAVENGLSRAEFEKMIGLE